MSLPSPRYEGPVVTDFLTTLELARNKLGDLFWMPFGKQDLLMLCHPDLAYEVLVKQSRTFVKLGADGQTPGLKRVLGSGLLTNPDYDSWFNRRQLMQPFFQRHHLNFFSKQIVSAAHRLIDKWRTSNTETINLTQDIFQITLELMFELVFSMSADEAKKHPLVVPLSLSTARPGRMKREVKMLDEILYSMIHGRKAARAYGKKFDDFCDLLLNAKDKDTGERLSDQALRDELMTIFAAGHETTANAILWTFKALSEHPECLTKVKLELSSLDADLNPHTLKELPYLQAVFKETLRLYPTIPFAPRVTLKDTELAGYKVPKGSRVFVSIYSVHRNSSFWETPKRFYPERFLQKDVKMAYLPFGLGERVCIGQHLASLEVQLILATLLQNANLSILNTEDLLPRVAISLQPKQDFFVSVTFS